MESNELKNISHELMMLRRELEELKDYVRLNCLTADLFIGSDEHGVN